MKIQVEVTSKELKDMGFDESSLVEHIIDTLDGDSIELVGYNVNVIIRE